jgi:hypothetical protein
VKYLKLLKKGICGERNHFWVSHHQLGSVTEQDYVSCFPFRVPIAHLAAAQANLK